MSTMTKTIASSIESQHKKSTSGEAPIPKQDYGTTLGIDVQLLSEIWFDQIDRHSRPLKRPASQRVDRAFRRRVEEANLHGDCIINNGEGYFRPSPDDSEGRYAYALYRTRELKKAKAIIEKISAMDKAFIGGTK